MLFSDSCQLTITWMSNWCPIYRVNHTVLCLGTTSWKVWHFTFFMSLDAAPFRVKRVPCSLNANQLVWKEWKWFELTSISNHVTIHSKGVPWGCWVNPVLTIPLSVTTVQNVFTGSSWHQSLRTFLCCEKTMIKLYFGWTTWDSTLLHSVTIDS